MRDRWPRPPSTPPGHLVPGHLVPGHLVPGHLVPGHLVPGHLVPGRPRGPVTDRALIPGRVLVRDRRPRPGVCRAVRHCRPLPPPPGAGIPVPCLSRSRIHRTHRSGRNWQPRSAGRARPAPPPQTPPPAAPQAAASPAPPPLPGRPGPPPGNWRTRRSAFRRHRRNRCSPNHDRLGRSASVSPPPLCLLTVSAAGAPATSWF